MSFRHRCVSGRVRVFCLLTLIFRAKVEAGDFEQLCSVRVAPISLETHMHN